MGRFVPEVMQQVSRFVALITVVSVLFEIFRDPQLSLIAYIDRSHKPRRP